MDISTHNTQVYLRFIEDLLVTKRVGSRQDGTFQASIKIPSHDRYSPNCELNFTFIYSSENYRISVHVDSLLHDNETFVPGLFPSGFWTNENPDYKPMKFEQVGRSLRITGVYFGKDFEAIITPL